MRRPTLKHWTVAFARLKAVGARVRFQLFLNARPGAARVAAAVLFGAALATSAWAQNKEEATAPTAGVKAEVAAGPASASTASTATTGTTASNASDATTGTIASNATTASASTGNAGIVVTGPAGSSAAAPVKTETRGVRGTKVDVNELKAMAEQASGAVPISKDFDPLKYTLGPEDVVEITVMRHTEFSGTYPINQEGKLQYKFVGDILVAGMTKGQLEERIREIISKYVVAPEVNVTVTEYKSKVFYVIGEVGAPGKYYMRSETISVRDAVVMAGLPTQAAAMRKSQIITPGMNGGKVQHVDLYGLLYGGDLNKNLSLRPGDFLYVPSTVMAKVFRVISPVSNAVGVASSPATTASQGKTGAENLAR